MENHAIIVLLHFYGINWTNLIKNLLQMTHRFSQRRKNWKKHRSQTNSMFTRPMVMEKEKFKYGRRQSPLCGRWLLYLFLTVHIMWRIGLSIYYISQFFKFILYSCVCMHVCVSLTVFYSYSNWRFYILVQKDTFKLRIHRMKIKESICVYWVQ